jgi:hypothetical protein
MLNGLTQAEARESQRVVANATYPVLGLPHLLAFDADSRVQYMVPSQSDEAADVGRLAIPPVNGFAEHGPKVGTQGSECDRRREPKVKFETGWQEKGPVNRWRPLKIKVMERPEVLVHKGTPLLHYSLGSKPLRHTEEQIDIGPPILGTVRT